MARKQRKETIGLPPVGRYTTPVGSGSSRTRPGKGQK